MPVPGGAVGPLGYAQSARQASEGDDNTASPQPELQDQPSPVVTPLRPDRDLRDRDSYARNAGSRDSGASPGMPSSRDVFAPRGGSLRDGLSLRDVLSSQDGLGSREDSASRKTLPLRDVLPMRPSRSSREGSASRDGLASRDAPPLRPTLFPREGLPSRETTSLRDIPTSPPAPPFEEDLNAGAEPPSFSDDADNFGLAPPSETTSHWEAAPGPSLARPLTGSATTAEGAWKRKKRREVFEGDAALKELWARLADAPADEAPEPALPPRTKMPIARTKAQARRAKTRMSASTMRFSLMALAAGGALGFLWVTPTNRQAGEDVAKVSLQETPRPVAQNTTPDPAAAGEQAAATGAALYQDFLRWRQQQKR